MYSIFRKKIYILPLAIFLIFFINILSGNRIYLEANALFSKEINYLTGQLENTDEFLAGRWGGWRAHLSYWANLPLIEKAIGTRYSSAFHNQYLQLLFRGGVLLLSLFIIIGIFLVVNIFSEYVGKKKFIHFVALLSFIYFFVESLGQWPLLYPHINPATWGIIGLSLNKNLKWTDEK